MYERKAVKRKSDVIQEETYSQNEARIFKEVKTETGFWIFRLCLLFFFQAF